MAEIIDYAIAAVFVAVGAVLLDLIRDQAKASTPWLADWLRRQAVKRLPEPMRKQADEEWASWLDETPGPLAKLFCAFGFLISTFKFRPPSSREADGDQSKPLVLKLAEACAKAEDHMFELMFRIYEAIYPDYDRNHPDVIIRIILKLRTIRKSQFHKLRITIEEEIERHRAR